MLVGWLDHSIYPKYDVGKVWLELVHCSIRGEIKNIMTAIWRIIVNIILFDKS
jgi:hypothetical protein